jgi:hypothetical protein
MDWFYAKNGQQSGPVEKEQLDELFRSGQITSSDLVWNASMSDWAPIGTLPEFSHAQAGQTPATPDPLASTPSPEVAPSDVTPTAISPAPYSGEKIPTYLWQSIVAIICCCLPAGVVSLVYAIKVDPAIQAGNIAAAKEASKNAKMWFWISFGVGIVVQSVFFGLGVIGALTE